MQRLNTVHGMSYRYNIRLWQYWWITSFYLIVSGLNLWKQHDTMCSNSYDHASPAYNTGSTDYCLRAVCYITCVLRVQGQSYSVGRLWHNKTVCMGWHKTWYRLCLMLTYGQYKQHTYLLIAVHENRVIYNSKDCSKSKGIYLRP